MEEKKKSLLFLAFPRSISTRIADVAATSLEHELQRPNKYISCEVLYASAPGLKNYREYDKRSTSFKEYKKVLDQYSKSYLIKDVNSPFVCKKYIQKHPQKYNVIFIQRSFVDITYAMFNRGWFWPIRALWDVEYDINVRFFTGEIEERLKSLSSKAMLRSDPFFTGRVLPLLVDSIIYTYNKCFIDIKEKFSAHNFCHKPGQLFKRLRALGYNPQEFNYITPAFTKKLEQVSKYKEDPLWHIIKSLYRDRGCDAHLL